MESSSNRRTGSNSGVGLDTERGRLIVGERTALLADTSDRSQVLRTYIDLVAEQRIHPPQVRADLRDRDLVSLAGLLDLPADELERYVDRELTRFVAIMEADAARADVVARVVVPEVRKSRVGRVIVGAVLLAAAGGAVVASVAVRVDDAPAEPAEPTASPTTVATGTVRIEPDPDGTGTVVVSESPPVPGQADGTEIVGAIRLDREG